MSARSFAIITVLSIALTMPAQAQTNSGTPAELPPAGYDGREFTDSRGCVFLRSTFGGAVTWVPRYGPDRQPVCGGTPSIRAEVREPAIQPVPQPVGSTARPAPAASGKEPLRGATAPRRATPRRAVPRRPDASGRHPDCPLNAPYGQVVRTSDARLMVLCVAHPDHFPAGLGSNAGHHGPVVLPSNTVMPTSAPAPVVMRQHGSHLQVGSFRVPANATGLRARLQAHGLPAGVHMESGLNVVTIGPLADAAQAGRAMQIVRAMGFRDAYFRR
ncbi:SPOR domain-containing protein [Roseinatronobacter alkalisoli]|uniref:SPOR domain-containing protein n=1 Tax=Roseinatronobacter alkalisoli TaxID=3028235 RepID=A0ABT5T3P6_9RHOB|nr:SPOR domain-containing protein [Roseinatronobacter sp. HJB301]MDD7969747.1 SPOR domain-containing protein [Roseinatronobacter sp. HJB301]